MIGMNKCYVVAEIGINHNGSLDLAMQMMKCAKTAGCDAVKFQKRTVEIVYSPEELSRPRENPFGPTNGDLKRGLEFDKAAYDKIDRYAKELNIEWFASPWDEQSVDFLMTYDIPYIKIASASVTDKELLQHCIETGKPLLISTGMCDLSMIRTVVDYILGANGKIACLYHCISTYPAIPQELDLLGIQTLKSEFPEIPIGYSGHEVGVPTSLMAAVLGAVSIERHLTLDRAMWGSDQAASLEPSGMQRLVRDIHLWEQARGNRNICLHQSEIPIMQKLRRRATLIPSSEAIIDFSRETQCTKVA